jgi:hypothetical protein
MNQKVSDCSTLPHEQVMSVVKEKEVICRKQKGETDILIG